VLFLCGVQLVLRSSALIILDLNTWGLASVLTLLDLNSVVTIFDLNTWGLVYSQELKRNNKNAESVNTTGMDYERMFFCALHHPMDAETHNIPPAEYI
jgi:uncharacterized membrane protein